MRTDLLECAHAHGKLKIGLCAHAGMSVSANIAVLCFMTVAFRVLGFLALRRRSRKLVPEANPRCQVGVLRHNAMCVCSVRVYMYMYVCIHMCVKNM